ncbi:MAG: MOP flippase family protein [Deltaproteobacteria bacterium]
MTLRHKTFTAVRWTTAAALSRALLQLVQVAVLARLLAPTDYGLIAMVGVVLGIAGLFSDLGLNSAYIQKQDVAPEHRSSLFWLNVGMSSILTILVVITSPVVAFLFGDERLTLLLISSAPVFAINAVGQQIRMTREKELNFKPVVLLELVSALTGFATAIIAALAGLGVYSMVLGGIATALAGTLMAWLCIAGGWRPLWRFSWADVRPYIGFGGALVANDIINQINVSIDIFLGGRLLGASQLGLFSVPRTFILQIQFLVNPIITRVGFPLIAHVQQDIPRVRSIYLKTLNMTASVNAPIYFGLLFFASEIVHVLLGHNWTGSVNFLRILAIWGFFRSTGNPVGSLLMGMGRADLSLKWNTVMLFVIPPILWIGSQFGAEGLAWALLGFSVVMFVPGWYILVRPLCQAGLLEYTIAALRPMLIAIVSIAPAYWVANHLENSLLRLFSGIALAAPLYIVISIKGNREWLQSMMQLIGRKNPEAS